MKEVGRVAKVIGGKAIIRMAEGPGCAQCNLCRAIAGGAREIEVAAALDLEPGDAVEITVDPRSRLRASALVFLIPLLVFFGALGAAEYFLRASAYRDPLSLLCGLLSVTAAFLAVSLYDRRLRARGIELVRVEKLPTNSPPP